MVLLKTLEKLASDTNVLFVGNPLVGCGHPPPEGASVGGAVPLAAIYIFILSLRSKSRPFPCGGSFILYFSYIGGGG